MNLSVGLTKHALHGRGNSWDRYSIERLVRQLIQKKYLTEEICTSTSYACAYLKVGPNVTELTDAKVFPEWLKLINI